MSCPSTQYHGDRLYKPEIWTWFGIGTIVTMTRLVIRLRKVGLKDFQGDDFLAMAVWMCFAGKSVALTLVFLYGSNMDYDGTAVLRLNQCQIERVVRGSQMELLAWCGVFTYISIIWGLKGMVLIIFDRLRLGVDRLWLFRVVVMATAVTYVAMFLCVCLGCLPFAQNWQVEPPPPPKCSMRMHNVWVSTILNVVTDLLILTIPIPTLWTSRFTTGKKIGLTLLLCSGLFVMSAAVIRFGFTIVGSTSVNLNNGRWCQRETTVGIVAVNMPILWSWLNPLIPRTSRTSAIRWPMPKSQDIIAEVQSEPRIGIISSCLSDATRIQSHTEESVIATTREVTSNLSSVKRTESEAKSSTVIIRTNGDDSQQAENQPTTV
ncbi:hypothetical protein DOTSEDRAFT_171646 [Dothistroma septosporum NZE10]|uniref:Rhodopsin domain-containing protein n=1 Tax=Dothistroma septosporum (strain NZE10 / CBS 128990) TaxID=675120 RepID=N1PJV7_DOTSN|nr:hypothetical protein DOTSEDRAFT_171646 [Dothistroma septosporum NZE10]